MNLHYTDNYQDKSDMGTIYICQWYINSAELLHIENEIWYDEGGSRDITIGENMHFRVKQIQEGLTQYEVLDRCLEKQRLKFVIIVPCTHIIKISTMTYIMNIYIMV